ncbi:MAG: hypothetical protein P4L33_03800 [Capsulimonadaceae bacterium]|nr:hypothetical protein [Capsulimonadaceae bacterium]
MWIYTRNSIVLVSGVAEIKVQLNGANSDIHVMGPTRPITLAVGTETVILARFEEIKRAIEATPEDRPTHLDFSGERKEGGASPEGEGPASSEADPS